MWSMEKVSKCFDSLVGVKQGEPLSPLSFIIYLNDTAETLDTNLNFENGSEIIHHFSEIYPFVCR